VPIFREAGPDASLRLVKQSKGFVQRAAYREMLSQLGGRTIEVQPEGDETLRQVKVNVRRAANELDLPGIRYGQTAEGSLLVWADATATGGARRRSRPRQSREASPSPE